MATRSAQDDPRELLCRSPLFAGLPDGLLDAMLPQFQRERCRKGLHLDPGMTRTRFFVILRGRMEVTRSNPDTGKRIVLFLLGPGDGFDVITLLDGRRHDTESVVLDDMQLLSAPIDRVRKWIASHPEFNQRFLPYLGRQFRAMETLASDLALHDTASRLARLILRHTDPDRHTERPHPPLPVRLISDLSHESLAHMVGSVRQVVNRHLQGLRREGIIDGRKGSLVVHDLEALKHQAGALLHRIERGHAPPRPDPRR